MTLLPSSGALSDDAAPGVLMNAIAEVTRRYSVCPHDCPSVCALDVEVIGGKRIGRIHGARNQTYTSGVICAKVARYWERIHHPERLTQPLRLAGPKGSSQFLPISREEALDRVADNFLSVERCMCGSLRA
jgi:anaerobic selenocysteine-containing dehydrogenase